MPITPPLQAQYAGMPGQWTDSIAALPEGLIVSETPPVVTVDLPLGPGTYLAYTPVTFAADGLTLEAAAQGEPAIGIILYDIVVPAGQNRGVPVMRAAGLNKDMITWPASYTTDAQKFAAFEGAPSPTNIVVKQAYRGSVVTQP